MYSTRPTASDLPRTAAKVDEELHVQTCTATLANWALDELTQQFATRRQSRVVSQKLLASHTLMQLRDNQRGVARKDACPDVRQNQHQDQCGAIEWQERRFHRSRCTIEATVVLHRRREQRDAGA